MNGSPITADMLILLPPIFGLVLLIALTGAAAPIEANDWRRSLVITFVAIGLLVAGSAELLGLFGWINRAAISIVWALALVAALSWGWRSNRLRIGWDILRSVPGELGVFEAAVIATMALIAVVLAGVAVVAPTNNADSLLYHMSRVMHWAQNSSLRHYATAYNHQLFMPPWAELAILHSRLLWGDDRLANLVQWGAMVGSTLLAPGIAVLLGARGFSRFLTAAFVFSIPMGILQSTSTQNDYVAALWGLCAAYLLMLSARRRLTWFELGLLGAALGLGVMTKATFLAYGLPIGLGFVIVAARRAGWGRALLQGALAVLLVALINAGVWSRNLATYGGLYGSGDWMGSQLAPVQLLSDSGSTAGSPPHPGLLERAAALGRALPGWAIPRGAQAVALHLVTPSFGLNQTLWGALDRFPALFGSVTSQSLANAAWNHEDTAGGPLHLGMIGLSSIVLVLAVWRRTLNWLVLGYAAVVLGAALLLVLLVEQASSSFGARFHLPLFVLWSPLIGVAAAGLGVRWITRLLAIGLLVMTVPYVLFNNMRPVIGRTPWPTRIESVFQVPAEQVLFAAQAYQRRPYTEAADRIDRAACTQVGLRLDSGDFEYAVWWVLDAPQNGVRIENVFTFEALERYLDRTFRPCAIICTICEGRERLHGLPLTYSRTGINLYQGPDFTWDPDG